jgi:hypothetical protein
LSSGSVSGWSGILPHYAILLADLACSDTQMAPNGKSVTIRYVYHPAVPRLCDHDVRYQYSVNHQYSPDIARSRGLYIGNTDISFTWCSFLLKCYVSVVCLFLYSALCPSRVSILHLMSHSNHDPYLALRYAERTERTSLFSLRSPCHGTRHCSEIV